MSDDGPAFDPDDLDFTDDERVEEIDDGRYVVSAGSGPPRVPSDAERLAELLGESTESEQAERTAETESEQADRTTETDTDTGGSADSRTDTGRGRGPTSRIGTRSSDAGTSSPQEPESGTPKRSRSRSERRPISSRDVSRWLAASFEDDGFEFGFDATLSVGDEVVRHRMVSGDVSATFETLLTWFTRNAAGEAPIDEALGILIAASETPVQFPRGTLDRYVERHGLTREDSIGDLLAVAEAHGGLRIETSSDGESDESDDGADARTGNPRRRTDESGQPTREGRGNERNRRSDRDRAPRGTDSRGTDSRGTSPKSSRDDEGGDAGAWNWIGEDPDG
ncbi:hypothetical protein ACFQAS_09365 [Halopenitus salinus]|uniref:Uncharacterized protein n=1 Tax=Halopenitus salinus TaxID=1198295 RepID=A0ABD5UP04_9EURY